MCDPIQTLTFLQNNAQQVILGSVLILFYLCFKHIVNPSHTKYPKTACQKTDYYILSNCSWAMKMTNCHRRDIFLEIFITF